jgi:molybdopterin synthase catalytic subunit
MIVSLRLFAALREAVGERDLALELGEGATVRDLRDRLRRDYPAVRPLLDSAVFAVNDEYVAFEERLKDGAQVALIPPVSGGSGDLYRVTTEPLEASRLTELIRRDESGAIDLFLGVVRNHNDGHPVDWLEYEAHESMALRKLREVGEETKRHFPQVSDVGAWHRVGRLEIGETSLLVAVSAPHRKEAFEACHWAVDRIKEVVPVWKKEYGPDGAFWVEGHAIDPPHLSESGAG